MAPKTRLDELAVFGAPPAFAEQLHVGRPSLPDRARLLERINDILDRRWLTNDGPYVRQFERRIADHAGVAHSVAMSNGTVALEIAVRAAELSGEVIVPSFTFIATAHALQWQRITPVFCDIEPASHNIDPRRIEGLITPRTTGIIGVHLWGRPCDVEALARIAERHKLKLLFDASHAFGCTRGGRMVGGFGLAEVFSFHATKFLNAFEGGAVLTNDDSLAAKMRLMRNFGFAGYDNVIYLGTNGKMSEVSAAMGLTSLESCHEFIAANRRNYEQYRQELQGAGGVSLVAYDPAERSNYQYVVVEVDELEAQLSRDELLEVLWAENVLARRYFYPGCHRMEPYRSTRAAAETALAVTEAVARRVLSLPTGSALEASEVETISSIVRVAVANGPEVSRRLRQLR